MDKQKVKVAARSAFDRRNYISAFNILWELGVDDFIVYAEKTDGQKKENWFVNPFSAEIFWGHFVLDDEIFFEVFKSDFSDVLLYNYFSQYTSPIHKFESKLTQHFPALYIKSVRLNQVFFKPERIEMLCSICFEDDLIIHQKVWRFIYDVDQRKWNNILEKLNSLSEYTLKEILCYVLIYLETIRYRNSEKKNIHLLATAYSFFIELVLTEYPEKCNGIIDSGNFFDLLLEIIIKQKKVENNSVTELIDEITDWVNFNEGVILPYSFDLNIKPIQKGKQIFLHSPSDLNSKWLLNGIRYEINQFIYQCKGIEFVMWLEENKEIIIPGDTETIVSQNRALAGMIQATRLILSDLGVDFLKFKTTSIPAEKLFVPFITYSFNRFCRYEYNLSALSKIYGSWSQAFGDLTCRSIEDGFTAEPYILMTENQYIELNKQGLQGKLTDSINELIDLFSFHPNEIDKFDRYNLKYDVWKLPFVRIGNFLFSPLMFFANNAWFYSLAQYALTYRKPADRSETRHVESNLANKMREKGWMVREVDVRESNELQGDVDIFIEEDNYLLFVQLKRTYFRTAPDKVHTEFINSDFKAASQLNEAEEFLRSPNSIYNITKAAVKWIVSTSFENVGETIYGCYKINYFELLYALDYSGIKRLKDLIDFMESGQNIKALISKLNKGDIPIKLRQQMTNYNKEYKQFLFLDNNV